MKNLKKKITTISIVGTVVIVAGVLFILNQGFGVQATAARYAFVTQTSTTFETGPFLFNCDGEAITYPSQHEGQPMELELDHNLVSPAIEINVKNFIDTNYTTQDISYVVSISDGTNNNHANYDFSINDTAVGSSDVSQSRIISGDGMNTDTISLKFNRNTDAVGDDTIIVKIRSLAPYEKEIVFQVQMILPEILVTFDAKGGTVSPTTTQIRYLSAYSTGTGLTDGQLPIPIREGYYFNGWYETDGDFDPSLYADKNNNLNTDVYDDFINDWQADGYNSFSEAVSNHWYQYGSSPLEHRHARRYWATSGDIHKYHTTHTLYAMWVPTSRTVKIVSPTSNAQTINCSTADGQTIISNSTSQTSSGTVNLLDEGENYLSVTFSCSISAVGYKVYNTGNITIDSRNFTYNENNPSTPGTYTLSPSLTPETYTVSFDANGGTVNPSSKQVTYLSNYGDLPTPTKTHNVFKGWYLNGTQITSSTTNVQTSNHTLTAQWESTARTITLESTAVKTYDDDQQIFQCKYVDESKNPGGNSMIYSVQTMPSSGTQSASTTPSSAIPYFYDDGDFECNVIADGYTRAYQGPISYGDTSVMSKTITLSPTAASDISGSYANNHDGNRIIDKKQGINTTGDHQPELGTLTNTRQGYYLVEMWGGKGGDGGGNYGASGGSAGYIYGVVQLARDDSLEYSLGGRGKDTLTSDSNKDTNGGANGGGSTTGADYCGGTGGGYSKLVFGSNIIAIAAGGGGGGGSGYLAGSSRGDKGGNGGIMSVSNVDASKKEVVAHQDILNGYAFNGVDGATSQGNNSGRAGLYNQGGINGQGVPRDVNPPRDGSYLSGGAAFNRGGGGGAGLYGGGGGVSKNLSNTGANPGGGGGGSSYVSNMFTFSGLSSTVTSRLTGSNPSTVEAGGLRITYIGKTLP